MGWRRICSTATTTVFCILLLTIRPILVLRLASNASPLLVLGGLCREGLAQLPLAQHRLDAGDVVAHVGHATGVGELPYRFLDAQVEHLAVGFFNSGRE